MSNLSKFHVVFSSSTLIRLDKDAFEGHLCQTVNNFVKQNKSSLLSPLRKRRPPQHIKHIRNTRVSRIPTFDEKCIWVLTGMVPLIHLHLRFYGCIRGTMPVRTHIHFSSNNGSTRYFNKIVQEMNRSKQRHLFSGFEGTKSDYRMKIEHTQTVYVYLLTSSILYRNKV